MADDKQIGVVTHYYDKIKVAIVKLDEDLAKGARVLFSGSDMDFGQVVDDMQFDHKDVEIGKKGQEVGIKVKKKVREGNLVMEG